MMYYNIQKTPVETKLCGMGLGKVRCVYTNVITAGHTSIFSRGIEHMEFQISLSECSGPNKKGNHWADFC